MSILGKVGGKVLSSDMQKIYDKLVELLKDGKKLNISIDELKKKAGVPNAENSAVSALIIREKKKGSFKNLTVKKFSRGAEVGQSQYDLDYKNNKKFRDFYNKTYKTPWNEIDQKTNLKDNSWKAFLNYQRLKKSAKGFTLTGDEMAKKLGITLSSLKTYEAKPDFDTSTRFIADNIKKTRTVDMNPKTGLRETVVRYKDPGVNVLKNWNALISSPKITSAMVDNIKEYDKVFRKAILKNKELPDIGEVIDKTSMKTPTTIANTEALYSRLLKGETFRTNIDIAKDAVLGRRIMDGLAIDSVNNQRRSAFYDLALKKVDELYPQKSGSLEDFKTNFRTELRKTLGLKKGQVVPFSVNEVISLSAGETRGIRPFSVFVDAVDTNINKLELRNYQGQFSKKLKKVDEILQGKGKYKNFSEPQRIQLARDVAGNLGRTQVALRDQLLAKGFTINQINQLNLPDIAVSKTIDPKHYTPERLAELKKGGVDIPQFVKDRKFYVDIKKAKPFWESNVHNTVIAAARNNVGNICNIFKGKIAYSADGGRIGFQGGCGREMTIAMQTDSKGTLQQITKTEGIIPKFKNVAQGFLGALGRFGPAAGKYGAIAAAGAIAQPLVKQFMNDDPSTYLTDPEQQAAMLEDLIERQERTKPPSKILDTAVTGTHVAGTAAAVPGTGALWKARRMPFTDKLGKTRPGMGVTRAALGPVGKFIAGAYTPAGLLAMEPLRIAQMRREGESWGEVAKSPTLWMGPAFADTMTKMATAGMKGSPRLARGLSLGMSRPMLKTISRRFGMPGLALSLGLSGYDQYQDYKKKRGFFARDEE